jgi:hypothetical protein
MGSFVHQRRDCRNQSLVNNRPPCWEGPHAAGKSQRVSIEGDNEQIRAVLD